MAGSVNKITLIGNLGGDPESKVLQSGAQMVSFSMATHEKWRDRDGNRHEKTQWHRVTIWNEHIIKLAMEYLRKGSKVYIEGQLEYRTFDDRDGKPKTVAEIVIPKFKGELVMLDSRVFDNGRTQEEPATTPPARRYDPNTSGINRVLGPNYKNAPIDDEVPF